MAITLNGTTGITTPDITSEAGLTVDGVSFASGAPANTLVTTSGGNVGIGTSSPSRKLDVRTDPAVDWQLRIGANNTSADTYDIGRDVSDGLLYFYGNQTGYNGYVFSGVNGERARIDSSGNLLVGKTATSIDTVGVEARANGRLSATMNGDIPLDLNRKTSDGTIALFRKDGSTVGSIGVSSSNYLYIGCPTGVDAYLGFANGFVRPATSSGSNLDNAIDIGAASARWDDVYATNGTIQTSDRNEKQDIEELSEAEQRVAVAAKSLMRKFRWKDAVVEKGDDARIHFGIIAQDLQAAFEAEGLDAGRYGMFIHSTWWETYTDVPAVEAVDAVYETQTDEEGNEVQVLVSEAVEAKEAYTRTDTYDSVEEAPEGAVEKSRMGVRYSELLAFIIAAL